MKILLTLFALSFTSCMDHDQRTYTLGKASFTTPSGWREVKRGAESLVFDSADGQQRLTISLMRFGSDPTFADFKLICEHRFAAERQELPDGFISPDHPEAFENRGTFGMFFFGGDKKSGRIFSGHLSLKGKELVSLYVEGFNIEPAEHLEAFKVIVSSLKRN